MEIYNINDYRRVKSNRVGVPKILNLFGGVVYDGTSEADVRGPLDRRAEVLSPEEVAMEGLVDRCVGMPVGVGEEEFLTGLMESDELYNEEGIIVI